MSDRRCTTSGCQAKAGAMSVSFDLPYATVLVNPRDEWKRIASGGNRVRVARRIDTDWSAYTPERFLFTHVSIVSSVEVEPDGHTIKVACNDLVNNNGNAWSNDVLLATFKTFIGGDNFLEHVQIESLSKGKILDAVARPIVYSDGKGNKANVFYVDLLIATDRKHKDLVADIESGVTNCLSMGCLCDWVQCSRCGKVFGDNEVSCDHIQNQLLNKYTDKQGQIRVTSELCGRMVKKNGVMVADPKSVQFIEASWVERPAFEGAQINHYISEVPEHIARAASSITSLHACVDDIFKLRVADKAGMMVLKVARRQMARLSREHLIGRVAAQQIRF